MHKFVFSCKYPSNKTRKNMKKIINECCVNIRKNTKKNMLQFCIYVIQARNYFCYSVVLVDVIIQKAYCRS